MNATQPDNPSEDKWLDSALTYLVDNVQMIKGRILRGGLSADKGAEHNERLMLEAKQAITAHYEQRMQEEYKKGFDEGRIRQALRDSENPFKAGEAK